MERKVIENSRGWKPTEWNWSNLIVTLFSSVESDVLVL